MLYDWFEMFEEFHESMKNVSAKLGINFLFTAPLTETTIFRELHQNENTILILNFICRDLNNNRLTAVTNETFYGTTNLQTL